MSDERLNDSAGTASEGWLMAVKEEVDGLRFGTVQVVVHEGEVVQIERVSRRRLGPSVLASRNPSGFPKSISLRK